MNVHHKPPLSAQLIENQLLKYKQLSEFLDVPVPTLKDWVYKRKIPFKKVGRHIRFDPLDIRKWLNERGKDVN